MGNLFITTVYDVFNTFLHSTTFFVVKIFLVIYTTVLVVDVILLMYLGNVRDQLRNMRMGSANVKTTKRKEHREWKVIVDRLDSGDEKQYRAAILEADHFVYKSLNVQGYNGSTFAERVAQIPAGSFSTLDIVRDVHALSKKIIHDKHLRITKEQAKNALDVYKKFLIDLDIL